MPVRRHVSAALLLLGAAIAGSTMLAGCTAAAARSAPATRAPSTLIAAATGGSVTVTAPGSPLDGAAIDVPPGALASGTRIEVTTAADPLLAMFSGLTVVRVTPEVPLAAPAQVRIPYTEEMLRAWRIDDPRQLALYARDEEGNWSWTAASFDAGHRVAIASVDRLGSWVVAPAGLLTAWQSRRLTGTPFAPGARNALVIHGWNASPWDGCMLGLIEHLAGRYDHVLAYAYPSALDVAANAAGLRDRIESRYPDAHFDVIAFSEGGLVARAAIEPGDWNGGRTIGARVDALLTIATPHLGLLPDAPPSILGDPANTQMRPGSTFLRALNAHPYTGGTRYYAIGGTGADGVSDGIVSAGSALARGVLTPAASATLPLVHARASSGAPAMPCDEGVYDLVEQWLGQ